MAFLAVSLFFAIFHRDDAPRHNDAPRPPKSETLDMQPVADRSEAFLSPSTKALQEEIRQRARERGADAESLALLEAATARMQRLCTRAKAKDDESLKILMRFTEPTSKRVFECGDMQKSANNISQTVSKADLSKRCKSEKTKRRLIDSSEHIGQAESNDDDDKLAFLTCEVRREQVNLVHSLFEKLREHDPQSTPAAKKNKSQTRGGAESPDASSSHLLKQHDVSYASSHDSDKVLAEGMEQQAEDSKSLGGESEDEEADAEDDEWVVVGSPY